MLQPPLVQLLRLGAPPDMRTRAVAALGNLALVHASKATIAAAGAMVQLLGQGSSALEKADAATALANFTRYDSKTIIAAAGAVPAQVELMVPGISVDTQLAASRALMVLGVTTH
jgi:hypothetical protein